MIKGKDSICFIMRIGVSGALLLILVYFFPSLPLSPQVWTSSLLDNRLQVEYVSELQKHGITQIKSEFNLAFFEGFYLRKFITFNFDEGSQEVSIRYKFRESKGIQFIDGKISYIGTPNDDHRDLTDLDYHYKTAVFYISELIKDITEVKEERRLTAESLIGWAEYESIN